MEGKKRVEVRHGIKPPKYRNKPLKILICSVHGSHSDELSLSVQGHMVTAGHFPFCHRTTKGTVY